MKLRSFFVALAAVVIVLLLTAALSVTWILSQSPLNLLRGGTRTEPTAAMFVPKQAPIMVSLLVNPDRLEAFGQLATPIGNRRQVRLEFEQLKESLLTNTGIDYRDIQPWLGDEITLAVTDLDFDRSRENGAQPGYLLAVTAKDPELAREFLQLSFSRQAIAGTTDLVFEQYKGVNLIYKRPLVTQSSQVASAVVGDYVLFANYPKVLREAINNVQATELSLKSSASYQDALQTIVEPRVGIVYANLPALSAWIVNAPAPENPEAEQLLTVALKLERQGLAAQTALIGVAGEANQEPALAAPVDALRYVPANSVLTAAGTDLNQLWTQIDRGVDPDSPLKQLVNRSLKSSEASLGVDLPQDIFSWVEGEYALSLVSEPQRNRLGWVFVAETSPDAESAIARLDSLAAKEGLSVGSLPLLNTNITAWTKLITAVSNQGEGVLNLDAQVEGVHTAVDRYEIFATSLETMAGALAGTPSSLLKTDKFREAIAPLPGENNGVVYVDWTQGKPVFEQQLPLLQVVELAGKPLFDHLRSLALSSQGSENGVRRATVSFDLGARKR